MLLTFLAVQAAVLDADPARTAIACAHAVVESGGTPGNALRFTSQYQYFLMSAAVATPGTAKPMARLGALAKGEGDLPEQNAADATRLLMACDVRFPLARSTGPTPLPASDIRRDGLCAVAIGMAIDGMRGVNEQTVGDGATQERDRAQAVLNVYTGRLSDVRLALEGLDTDAKIDAFFDAELEASVKTGNIETIVASCARVVGK